MSEKVLVCAADLQKTMNKHVLSPLKGPSFCTVKGQRTVLFSFLNILSESRHPTPWVHKDYEILYELTGNSLCLSLCETAH